MIDRPSPHPLIEDDDETYWRVFIWFETFVMISLMIIGWVALVRS